MARVGFLMLCHTALNRAAQVARHWAGQGAPVVIHVDAQVPRAAYDRLAASLADLANVRFCRRYRCEWGTWSLVAATQAAAETMLAVFPGSPMSMPPRAPACPCARWPSSRPISTCIRGPTSSSR